jgi:hypothetical protein
LLLEAPGELCKSGDEPLTPAQVVDEFWAITIAAGRQIPLILRE